MDQRVKIQQKFYGPLKGNKINTTPFMFMLFYFSMVRIPLGLVTLRCAAASSRLNT